MTDVKIVAYACSQRPNHLWSAAQFDNALPKNRGDCDIPLVAKADYDRLLAELKLTDKEADATSELLSAAVDDYNDALARAEKAEAKLEKLMRAANDPNAGLWSFWNDKAKEFLARAKSAEAELDRLKQVNHVLEYDLSNEQTGANELLSRAEKAEAELAQAREHLEKRPVAFEVLDHPRHGTFIAEEEEIAIATGCKYNGLYRRSSAERALKGEPK